MGSQSLGSRPGMATKVRTPVTHLDGAQDGAHTLISSSAQPCGAGPVSQHAYWQIKNQTPGGSETGLGSDSGSVGAC